MPTELETSRVKQRVQLTSDHLVALQNAVSFVVAEQKRLHWNIVSLMSDGQGMGEQLKLTEKLAAQSSVLEQAMATVCQMFAQQFRSAHD